MAECFESPKCPAERKPNVNRFIALNTERGYLLYLTIVEDFMATLMAWFAGVVQKVVAGVKSRSAILQSKPAG